MWFIDLQNNLSSQMHPWLDINMAEPIYSTHSGLPYTHCTSCLLPLNWEPSVQVLTWRERDRHSGTRTNVVTTFQKVAGALWELWPYCSHVLVFSLYFQSVCGLIAWWAVELFCFSYKASKEAGKALVCKTNPTFEIQHHHLLHCLEKTTVRVVWGGRGVWGSGVTATTALLNS